MKKTNKKKKDEEIDEITEQELLTERMDELNYTILELLQKVEVFQELESRRLESEGKLKELSGQEETEEFKILQEQIRLLRKRLGLPPKTTSKMPSFSGDNEKEEVIDPEL